MRTLADYPYVTLRLGCSICPREGRYRLARLAEKHGAGINLVTLLSTLSADCPVRIDRHKPGLKQCGAKYVDLTGGPAPDEPPD